MGGSYVTMRREALIEGVSTGEGVAAARGHSTKHSTGRRRQIQGQTAARSPPPAAHSPSRKSTPHYIHYWLFYTSRGRGLYTTFKGWGGVLLQPGWLNRTAGRSGEGGRGRSLLKEALGDFNQALATRGRAEGLDSGLHREEMAPGKVKDLGLSSTEDPVEKPRLSTWFLL